MDSNFTVFIELCGYKFGEAGAEYLFGGLPVFQLEGLTKTQAYRAAQAVEEMRSYTMSAYAHALHPQYDEIDMTFYVYDRDEGDVRWAEADWCKILYLNED